MGKKGAENPELNFLYKR